jgi:hypothetical protein
MSERWYVTDFGKNVGISCVITSTALLLIGFGGCMRGCAEFNESDAISKRYDAERARFEAEAEKYRYKRER